LNCRRNPGWGLHGGIAERGLFFSADFGQDRLCYIALYRGKLHLIYPVISRIYWTLNLRSKQMCCEPDSPKDIISFCFENQCAGFAAIAVLFKVFTE
jgi:hypothetical protein